uniref:IQ motif containing N n=1 Tax=Myotis lucifugus TaxID=59463 RepID=G1P1F8_MYOLU
SDQPTPNYQDKAETPESRETLPQQPDKGKIPRLRKVVESKAFRNILVDEMDMMQSRAATLIQASWRRHKLRQKLVRQVLTAKGVQEAWRRFKARRRLGAEKKKGVEEENVPYHPPQQVRFHPSEEDRYLPAPPVMVDKETQFPSDDSLAACAHELALLQPAGVPPPGMPAPGATGGPSVTFVPHQTVSVRLACPVSLSAKYHPCLLTRTIRSTSLLHLEGDMTKTKPATARASKAGALGPPCERIAQTLHGPPKAQTQAHVEAEVLRAPPQTGQPSVMTKAPLKSCLASTMNKSIPQPGPTPTVIIAKTPPQPDSAVPVAKTTLQSCLAAILNKIPTQPSPVPTMIMRTPPQPCLAAPVTKTPAQMRPTVLVTSTAPQTQPAAMTSIFKPPTQTCPIPVMAKPLPQVHPTATMAKSLLQTCPVATTAKTPSQMLPEASTTKTPTQTRLAAMITKTPAQLRSVATVLRNLCLPPPADGNLKASPPAVVEDGIPNASSQTNLNRPNAKAVVSGRQTAGAVKVSSHSHLTEGKVKYWPPPHLGAGAPKAPARPFSEAEKIRAFSQKQVRIATMSNTSVAEDRSKVLSQARLKTDVTKVQSQVGVPVEMAVVLPQARLGTCPAKPLPRAQKTRAPPQANIARCLSKPPSQAHPPAKLTTAPSLAHPGTCPTKTQSQAHLTTEVIKVQSQAHLPARLTKAQSQAQLVTETAKCLYAAHQAAELSSKTRSQPLLAGFKASTQPHQHASSLGTLSRAKPEDGLTQLPAHSCAQGKATKGPCEGASKTPSMLVPLLASTGPSACNVESWGDSRATLAPPSATSPAAPCQEELGGPVDAGVAGGQTWNSAWKPARCDVPWAAMGREALVDPRRCGELVTSVQTVEQIIVQAVVVIQACARGYLVRRTIKVWHRWAVVIQAAWRGYCVRRNLAQLLKAATVIQATWRGYSFRRNRARQMLLPRTWAEASGRTTSTSDHRCFQSCRPNDCTLCQSLRPRLGSPPSAVMLMGSSPRTCHMCGHTQPTRVVQGTGRGTTGQEDRLWDQDTQLSDQRPQQPRGQNKAATVIQSIWRGVQVRRRLMEKQAAAKMLQSNWRGHYTRSSLTTDALLRPAGWDNPQNTQWPGV